MKKWNEYDTSFILKSLAISGIAILIWAYFYSGQINKNYLNISLTEEQAKQKAVQYFGSRGWDITGYTYSCKYTKSFASWWKFNDTDYYIKENVTDKDVEKIKNIDKLTGNYRWNMKWYNPPSSEEYHVSFTKDGDLAFFHHIIPDTLAGDSLPGEIAYEIAIMFLKNMTNINWQEKDWKIQIQSNTQRENRLDHYFQWENKLYTYGQIHDGHADNSKIRMSIEVDGNEVSRYNSWLQSPIDTNKTYRNWAGIGGFLDKFHEFLIQFIAVICLLVALFYFKIPTNWKIAAKYSIFLFCIYFIKSLLEIPRKIYDFASEDSFLGKIFETSLDILLEALFHVVITLLILSACEKLYRKIFPSHLSFNNILNPACYSSKLFFNNYCAGVVFALCILAFTGVYYTLLNISGYYIAYPQPDLNQMLTYNPLIYLISSGIFSSFSSILPFVLLILLLYLLTSSKIISIFTASVLFSIENVLDTDPIFLGSVYLFIVGIASGFMLFRYGILSLFISAFSVLVLSDIFLYFYSAQLYYITTGIIIILLLISPLIYCVLYYYKYQRVVTDSKSILNSAIPIDEPVVSEPTIPQLNPIETKHNKWAFLLLLTGLLCIFVPNNNQFEELFYNKISKSEALDKAKNTIENNFNEDLTDFQIGITQDHGISIGWSGETLGPFSLIHRFLSPHIAYINEKVSRKGIVELVNKYKIMLYSWSIKFYQPDKEEAYLAMINTSDGKIDFYVHNISDSLALPTVTQEEAINIIKSNLKTVDIDILNLPIKRTFNHNHNVRIDQMITFEKELTLDNESIINQEIRAGVHGNKVGFFTQWFDVPAEWEREYWKTDIMYSLTAYIPLVLMILSMLFALLHLINNSINERKIISWKLISILLISVIFIFITDYFNTIPVIKSWYWGQESWLVFWFDNIGEKLNELASVCFYVIVPTACAYLINPSIKNIFSKQSQKLFSSDAFISSLATFGAMFLSRPIEYILYTSFPHYINVSFNLFNVQHLFAKSFPGYGLFLTIAIETLMLFSFSIFFYHKYIKYSQDGKKLKRNLLFIIVSLFYLFNMAFLQSAVFMIPHFLYRLFGLIIFLGLIKYFWRGNPLSHLFGILIYFQLDNILSFISFADPSIKFHGWILIVLMGIFFVATVGIGAYKSRLSTNTA